ncbi:phage antirepressor KilAC domain-containing protein [Peptoanaerobacter stomatis]
MNELIKVNTSENGDVVVSGRELHEFLESKEPYTQWFDRMIDYGFIENVDFSVFQNFVKDDTAFGGVRKSTDHAIKLDMAKELAMIQRNEKGKQARQYFIAVEKEYNSPEKIMARALRIADETINNLKIQIQQDKPKVLFAQAVSASHTSILIGDLAKLLKQNGYDTGQKRLFEELRQSGYLIKSGSSKNMPTQKSMDMGLFEVKETTINNPDGSIRVTKTTKVTGKGQQYFINLFLRDIA